MPIVPALSKKGRASLRATETGMGTTHATDAANRTHQHSRLVRLSHWVVAVAVIFNLLNVPDSLHGDVGKLAVAVVLIRLLHGWLWPSPPSTNGHSRWLSMWLWGLVLGLGASGSLASMAAPPDSQAIMDLHRLMANFLHVSVLGHWLQMILKAYARRDEDKSALRPHTDDRP